MYKRQHPITILLELKISHLLPGLIPLISLKGKFPFWYMIPIALFVVTIVFAIIHWYYKVYWVQDNVLHIKEGMFVKKESYLNKGRVQTINTSSNVIYQLLGLTRLKIETAGGGKEPEVSLAGVTLEDAKALISLLNEEMAVKRENEEEIIDSALQEEPKSSEYKLTWKEIMLASITSGEFGIVFSVLLFISSKAHDYAPDWMIKKVEKYVMDFNFAISTWLYIAAILLVLSWILSTLRYAMKHANFTIVRNGNEIRVSQGLLEKKEVVLKTHRIQGITIKETLLREWLGYCSIHAEVIQNAEKGEKNVTIHPLMKKTNVPSLLDHLELPYKLETNLIGLPKVALRRYLRAYWIVFMIFTIPIAGAAIYFEKYMAMLVLLPLFAILTWLGYISFTAGGYALSDQQLTIVSRSIGKHTGLIRRRHIQSLTKTQTFFQRKNELCTSIFAIASSETGHHYKLKHMTMQDAKAMRDWFTRKNEKITLL
ncbi:PH domain-containing protein [Bacillus sp. C1]